MTRAPESPWSYVIVGLAGTLVAGALVGWGDGVAALVAIGYTLLAISGTVTLIGAVGVGVAIGTLRAEWLRTSR